MQGDCPRTDSLQRKTSLFSSHSISLGSNQWHDIDHNVMSNMWCNLIRLITTTYTQAPASWKHIPYSTRNMLYRETRQKGKDNAENNRQSYTKSRWAEPPCQGLHGCAKHELHIANWNCRIHCLHFMVEHLPNSWFYVLFLSLIHGVVDVILILWNMSWHMPFYLDIT